MRCLLNNYGECDETHPLGRVEWKHFDLVCIHKGEVLIRLLEEQEVDLEAGQAILVYPETYFDGHSKVPCSEVSVHHFIIDSGSDNIPDALKNWAGKKRGFEVFPLGSIATVNREIESIVEMAFQEPSPLVEDIRSALMILILARLKLSLSAKGSRPAVVPVFEKLTAWLQDRLHKPVSLEDMASRVNLSASHFRTRFKEQFGVSPGSYFLGLRMDEAARLLRETWTPIKDIAARTGYDEPAHFHRAFKSWHRTTPGEYRRKNLAPG